MKKFRNILSVLLVLALVLSMCFSAVADTAPAQPETPAETEAAATASLFEKFLEIYEYYKENHVHPAEGEDILLDTIKNILELDPEQFELVMHALARSRDKYSYYFTPEAYAEYNSQKQYSGIGITVAYYEGYTQATYINPSSPAAAAGIKAGDIIYTIEDTLASGLSPTEIVTRIRGDAETNILVGFYRPSDGSINYYMLTRAPLYSPTIVWDFYYPEGQEPYALVKISDFQGLATYFEFVDFIYDKNDKNVNRVIFDVRGNPGGDLSVVLELINWCVPEADKIICTIVGRDTEADKTVYNTTGRGNSFEKIAILTDSESASASELFAIALQDYGLAKVFGRQSFGKAIGQTHHTFPDGAVLSLSTFEVLSPNGTRYNDIGVIPDEIIDDPELIVPKIDFKPFNHDNYEAAVFGTENDVVYALEQRLVLLGVLDKADSRFDENTRLSLKSMQRVFYLPETGILDLSTFQCLTDLVNTVKNMGTLKDDQLSAAVEYVSAAD